MSEHTPGPWRVTEDAGHRFNFRITSWHRRHIAKVYAASMNPDPMSEANARLIAAAPDLLAALEALAADYAALCGDGMTITAQPTVLAEAHAAINRARAVTVEIEVPA